MQPFEIEVRNGKRTLVVNVPMLQKRRKVVDTTVDRPTYLGDTLDVSGVPGHEEVVNMALAQGCGERTEYRWRVA